MRRHRGGDYKTWHAEVLSKAHEYNEFSIPMVDNEIKAIAKSVSKWVWLHDADAEHKFRLRQKLKGKKGGIAKGAINYNKKVVAKILYGEGTLITSIARELEVTAMTVRRWVIE